MDEEASFRSVDGEVQRLQHRKRLLANARFQHSAACRCARRCGSPSCGPLTLNHCLGLDDTTTSLAHQPVSEVVVAQQKTALQPHQRRKQSEWRTLMTKWTFVQKALQLP